MKQLLATLVLAIYTAPVIQGNGLRGDGIDSASKAIYRSLIIGGNAAKLGEYPFFAYYDPPQCGGSLIAPDILLTAGHVGGMNRGKEEKW